MAMGLKITLSHISWRKIILGVLHSNGRIPIIVFKDLWNPFAKFNERFGIKNIFH